jgi:hypothetical protein
MGRQRTIDDAEFWRSLRIANRSQEDKATLLYLLTSPYSNIIGVYPIVPCIAASEMGWTVDQLIPVLERLASLELISFDKPSGFVWVCMWWYHNRLRAAFLGSVARQSRGCTSVEPSVRTNNKRGCKFMQPLVSKVLFGRPPVSRTRHQRIMSPLL